MPKRVQFKRIKGFKLPENCVRVTRPGKWGNMYKIGMTAMNDNQEVVFLETREDVIAAHERMTQRILAKHPDWLEPLRGKDLACFCKIEDKCHADTLLKYANKI